MSANHPDPQRTPLGSLRPRLSAWQLSLFVAVFIVAADNTALFGSLSERIEILSLQGAGFLLTLVLLMTGVLWFFFLIAGIGKLMKPLLAFFLILSAVLGYFTNKLDVVFDPEMIRNIIETIRDANAQEATELLSWSMLLHVVTFGVIPSLVVFSTKLAAGKPLASLGARALCVIVGLAIIVPVCLLNYKGVTYTGRENSELKFQITPIFALASVNSLVRDLREVEHDFKVIGGDAVQQKSGKSRIVGIMVVGETARADHFSLNGYARNTNPQLAAETALNFYNVASCGSSTAYSVPCMFSLRGRGDYQPDRAGDESNVLDILQHAGVNVLWIDVNSSCKGVCARINNINLRDDPDLSSPFYSDGGYFDEAMLPHLDPYLDDQSSDLLIVLHSIGSHGPAYSRRYPRNFGVFQPSCEKSAPQECSDSEVINAYDNTIVYTDYVLSEIIEKLKQREPSFESFMFYASDHGESLGENGIYLHGLPYAVAPRAQTQVPIIVWFSPGYPLEHGVESGGTSANSGAGMSHDNISHTLLGLFQVKTQVYQHHLDIFAAK